MVHRFLDTKRIKRCVWGFTTFIFSRFEYMKDRLLLLWFGGDACFRSTSVTLRPSVRRAIFFKFSIALIFYVISRFLLGFVTYLAWSYCHTCPSCMRGEYIMVRLADACF